MASPVHPKLIDAVLHRASLDAAFRRRLLHAPAEAVFEAFGARFPEGVRIAFLEKGEEWDEMYVLPDLQGDEDELTEEDLDSVAGGQDQYRWDSGL
jgi:hypothetical protein